MEIFREHHLPISQKFKDWKLLPGYIFKILFKINRIKKEYKLGRIYLMGGGRIQEPGAAIDPDS
jgi:hypothetical protein